MKFRVVINRRFKVDYYVALGTLVFGEFFVVGLPMYICIREVSHGRGGTDLLWMEGVSLVTMLALGSYLKTELNRGLNRYEFEERSFTVKKYYGKRITYTVGDITLCQFYPSCPIYKGMYSDAVFFVIQGKMNKPIIIYRDYHENFAMVRQWILENDIKVEVHDNPLGENHPKYIKFINKEI